jgi:hypothetical protein
MRSRVSPRGYLLARPSEDRKIRMTEQPKIGVTVVTCTIGIKSRQAIQKMLLKNQSVPKCHSYKNRLQHASSVSWPQPIHHPGILMIEDETHDRNDPQTSALPIRLETDQTEHGNGDPPVDRPE